MAADYLKERSGFKPLAKKYGKPAISIWHIFRHAGPEFILKFGSTKFNLHEEIKIPIPALLDPRTLKRVQDKAEDRAWWDHKEKKHHCLLKGLIFDATSGYSLTGLTMGKNWYYCSSRPSYLVPGKALESVIFEKVVELILHKESIRKAVFGSDDQADRSKELRDKLADLGERLKANQRHKANVYNSIENYEGNDMKTFMVDLKPKIDSMLAQQKSLLAQKQGLENELSSIPTLAKVESMRQQLLKRVKEQWQRQVEAYQDLPFDKKRELVLMLLEGRDEQGNRCGLHVQPKGNKTYTVKVHGKLEDLSADITPHMLPKLIMKE